LVSIVKVVVIDERLDAATTDLRAGSTNLRNTATKGAERCRIVLVLKICVAITDNATSRVTTIELLIDAFELRAVNRSTPVSELARGNRGAYRLSGFVPLHTPNDILHQSSPPLLRYGSSYTRHTRSLP
jgi:hypothetical protein